MPYHVLPPVPPQGLLTALGRLLAPARAPASLLAGAHYLLAMLFPLSGVALFYFPHASPSCFAPGNRRLSSLRAA